MKEIKAFVHRNRAGDVLRALRQAGFRHLTISDVKGTLSPLDSKEQDYSVELGESVITEVKLELVCETEQVPAAVRLILENARTGRSDSGVVYISQIDQIYHVGA